MLCEKCTKKATCGELCQEAEDFVGQDHGAQKEIITKQPLPDLAYDTAFDPMDLDKISSGRMKKLILQLHSDGLTGAEITYQLPCSRQYISKIILKNNRAGVSGGAEKKQV